MKTWVSLGLLSLGLVACTATPPASSSTQPAAYTERAAGALLFDPPVAAGQPPLQLARAPREPQAFVGYQDLVVTYFTLRRDDWQMDGFPDQYTQRAVSERMGVRYR